MITNNDVENLGISNDQTIANIKDLQSKEIDMFTDLQQGIANNSLTIDEENSIVQQINDMSQIRINLYKNLNGQTGFYSDNITSSMGTMLQQEQALYIVENELNEAKRRLDLIEEDRNNKSRLVQINTYYGDRYTDYADMMKTIVLVCLPIIVLAYVSKLGFIPSYIYNILLIILVVFIVIYMWSKISYLNMHDNMNYQAYNWNVNTSKYPKLNTSSTPGGSTTSFNPWSAKPADTCVGPECCVCGSSYDYVLNRCIPTEEGCSLYASPAEASTADEPSLMSSETAYGSL